MRTRIVTASAVLLSIVFAVCMLSVPVVEESEAITVHDDAIVYLDTDEEASIDLFDHIGRSYSYITERGVAAEGTESGYPPGMSRDGSIISGIPTKMGD